MQAPSRCTVSRLLPSLPSKLFRLRSDRHATVGASTGVGDVIKLCSTLIHGTPRKVRASAFLERPHFGDFLLQTLPLGEKDSLVRGADSAYGIVVVAKNAFLTIDQAW